MPRLLVCLSILTLLLPAFAFAQEQPADPAAGQRSLVPGNEIALVWFAGPRDGDDRLRRTLYDFVHFGNPALEDSLQLQGQQEGTGALSPGDARAQDVVAGDFNDDGRDQIIHVWATDGNGVGIAFPGTDLELRDPLPALVWTDPVEREWKPAGTLGEFQSPTRINLALADLDDDPTPELLFAFVDPAGLLRVEAYDVDGTALNLFADVEVAQLPVTAGDDVQRSIRYAIDAGDVDGDGTDELVVARTELRETNCSSSTGCWGVRVEVFEFDAGGFTLADGFSLYEQAPRRQELSSLGVIAADVDGDGSDEITAGFHERDRGSSQAEWFLRSFQFEAGALVPNEPNNERVEGSSGNTTFPMTLDAADFDNDGDLEVVYYGRRLFLYDFDTETQQFDRLASDVSGPFAGNTHRQLAIADLDGSTALWYEGSDTDAFRPEIITVTTRDISDNGGIDQDGINEVRVLRYTPGQFNFETLAVKQDERTDLSGPRSVSVVAGDFGDRGIRLGAPRYARETEIIQPLVVLNAPPIHFDVFGGTTFDVGGCFPNAQCDFSATYTEQTSSTVEVTTEVIGDWNLGAGLEGNLGGILGSNPVAGTATAALSSVLSAVDFSIEGSYGEGLTELVGDTRTITITSRVQIFQDDHLYANVVDYDVWEYPLFIRGEDAGHLVFVIPRPQVDAWFGASTPEATAYRPDHEPGNILSYPRDVNPRRQAQQVYEGSRYGLGTSAITWDVTRESASFSSTENRTRLNIAGNLDIALPIPTFKLNLNGDYSTQTFETHRTSVSNLEAVSIEFGPINSSVEGRQANYSVTPFAYWDRSGALVVDYAVEPSIARPGDEPTWWELRYGGATDLALNVPNRFLGLKQNDPNVSEAAQTRTKDLAFFPDSAELGDPVTVQALVRNYSLLPSPAGVPVRFFAGDPNAGGVPLTGTADVPDPQLPATEARGAASVSADITVPQSLTGRAVRIYAVIDPDNALSEIHETNNLGWAPLLLENAPSGTDTETPEVPANAELLPNYPNPFSTSTTLAYALDAPQHVRLTVYDLLGREVARLVDARQPAGLHELQLDLAGHAPGTYIAHLRTSTSRASRRVLYVGL